MLIVLLAPTATKSDFESRPHYSKQEIRRAILFYAKRYHLDPALLRAVIKAESGYRQHVVSRKGAIGLMQLTPDTAATLRVANVYDSMENIRGGAKQLRHLLNLYRNDLPLALAAYNAGVHRVKGRSVPRIRETRMYVRKVLGFYREFKKEGRSASVSYLHQHRSQAFALSRPDTGKFQAKALAVHPPDDGMINP
jgi:soluble lytic murein transglycosylase-like protein